MKNFPVVEYENEKMDGYLIDYPAVLNVNEVAEILGVAPKTVRKLIAEKQIVAIKVGRLIRIPKDRLIDFLGGAA